MFFSVGTITVHFLKYESLESLCIQYPVGVAVYYWILHSSRPSIVEKTPETAHYHPFVEFALWCKQVVFEM